MLPSTPGTMSNSMNWTAMGFGPGGGDLSSLGGTAPIPWNASAFNNSNFGNNTFGAPFN